VGAWREGVGRLSAQELLDDLPLDSIEWVRCLAMGFLLESPVQLAHSQVPALQLQKLFCTNCFIPRLDLGLLVQNHVQQGFMDFEFSVVFDKTQLAEFVHEKTYP
jgi:hypothetical protein